MIYLYRIESDPPACSFDAPPGSCEPWAVVDPTQDAPHLPETFSTGGAREKAVLIPGRRVYSAAELAEAVLDPAEKLPVVGGSVLAELPSLRKGRAAAAKAEADRRAAEAAEREARRDAEAAALWAGWEPQLEPYVIPWKYVEPQPEPDPLEGWPEPHPGMIVLFVEFVDPFPIVVGRERIDPPIEPTRDNPNPPVMRDVWGPRPVPPPAPAHVVAVHPRGRLDLKLIEAGEMRWGMEFSPTPKPKHWTFPPSVRKAEPPAPNVRNGRREKGASAAASAEA